MTESEQKRVEDEGLAAASRTLAIQEVPVIVLDKIEAIGLGMTPRVRRNDLIVWILEEFSAGRLVPVARDQAAA